MGLHNADDRRSLTRYAMLSVGAALFTMATKAGAYLLTGSVGLLSDALESGVNLVAAFTALAALNISAQPPDEEHAYGHQKVEYFSSGAEGGLILLAAVAITITAAQRLLSPLAPQRIGLGLALSVGASVVNFIVARVLIHVGRTRQSIALEADGRHLLSDVWTSAGVLLGVSLVAVTGWLRLDPIVALLVAAYIGRSGTQLLMRSARGLMDTALPAEQVRRIKDILDAHCREGLRYHALRTRQSGPRSFVSVQVQVPGEWSVQRGHDLMETIEDEIRAAVPGVTVFTHIEPLEDPRSWIDEGLDRTT